MQIFSAAATTQARNETTVFACLQREGWMFSDSSAGEIHYWTRLIHVLFRACLWLNLVIYHRTFWIQLVLLLPTYENLQLLYENHWYFRISGKVGYKTTSLFFVNIFYIFNVATFILAFLEAKLSDMISTGILLEKSRILEKVFCDGANGVVTRQWGKRGQVCILSPWSSTRYFKALKIGQNSLHSMKAMHFKYNLCSNIPVFAWFRASGAK